MSLSDTALRAAKPQAKHYKLYDSNGLFAIVRTSGAILWRFRYNFHGHTKELNLGAYPTVPLKLARRKRDDAKILIDQGLDPGAEKVRREVRQRIEANNTFSLVASEFIEKIEGDGLAERTKSKTRWLAAQLEELNKRPVTEIEPYEVLTILKKIERRGNHETAKRVRAFAARVFRYAIITGRCRFNPAADLGEALITPKVKHYAAIVDPGALGGLLRAIDALEGFSTTKFALQIAPHLFVRPGELRHAEWSEIDFEKQVWRIPAEKMKMRQEHVVPLSTQATNIFRNAYELRGRSNYVFPSIRTHSRPMSENTINVALRRLGYSADEMTAHGFRSTASTLLNESGKWSPDAIERALAHFDNTSVRGIYHRGSYWEERVRMAQWWSDYLDRVRDGAEIIPISSAKG